MNKLLFKLKDAFIHIHCAIYRQGPMCCFWVHLDQDGVTWDEYVIQLSLRVEPLLVQFNRLRRNMLVLDKSVPSDHVMRVQHTDVVAVLVHTFLLDEYEV